MCVSVQISRGGARPLGPPLSMLNDRIADVYRLLATFFKRCSVGLQTGRRILRWIIQAQGSRGRDPEANTKSRDRSRGSFRAGYR